MKKLICEWFGHVLRKRAYSNRYFKAKAGGIDGIKRQHINIYAECDKLNEDGYVPSENGVLIYTEVIY